MREIKKDRGKVNREYREYRKREIEGKGSAVKRKFKTGVFKCTGANKGGGDVKTTKHGDRRRRYSKMEIGMIPLRPKSVPNSNRGNCCHSVRYTQV